MTSPPLALAATLAAALAVCRPSPRQRSLALSLAALLALNLGRPLLAPWLPLYVAGFVAWYALTSWAVASTLAPETPRTGQAFALLACASGVALRFDVTAELARASFALALATQALAVLRFASRGRRPDDAQRVALILAASSLADVAGPWLAGHSSRDWHVGRIPAVITWIAVSAWEGRCLMNVRRDRG